MKSIHFSKTEWALLLGSVMALILLSSCGWFHRGPVQPGDGSSGISGGPAGALAKLAVFATWAAGAGLFACGIIAVLRPERAWEAGKLACYCLGAFFIAGILHWISAHWAVLMGLCASVFVLCGLGRAYCHRKAIEKATGIDIDRDGKVG